MNLFVQVTWWAGGVLAALSLALLAWALFSDRSRGRRRCPGCWYDMNGVAGMTCPECGRTQKKERGLLQTRRRWDRALLALACQLIGVATALGPAIYTGKWILYTPAPVLRAALTMYNDGAETAFARAVRPGGAPRSGVERLLVAQAVRTRIQELLESYRKPVSWDAAAIPDEPRTVSSVMPLIVLPMLGDAARIILPEPRAALREELLLEDAAKAHVILGPNAASNADALRESLDRAHTFRQHYTLLLALSFVDPGPRTDAAVARFIRSTERWDSRPLALELLALSQPPPSKVPEEFRYVLSVGDSRERIRAVRVLGILGHSRERGRIPSDAWLEKSFFPDFEDITVFPTPLPLEDVRPLLEQASSDPDPEVRQQAESVLKGLPPPLHR
jgi:hypothetical protein